MKRLAQTLILALALGAQLGHANPMFAREPSVDAPVLLAAAPGLSGPYGRTVLLALPSGGGTHIGFILNRPTEVSVSAVLPEVAAAEEVATPVFAGGPHLSRTLIALTLAPQSPTEDSVEVLPGLHMAFGKEEAARVATRFAKRTRFFAGLVAWEGGELQAELRAGAWHVFEPDLDVVIGGSADTLWQRLLERMHTLVAMR
jgi:putative transcriptional regulator